jgi:site-specific DNA-methyltransferase (adenine-specific)
MVNKVFHGDCLEVMKSIPDGSVDMILCDLPYGTTACKWDVIIPFDNLWKQYERIIKSNGAIVLTASQPFTSTLINSNIKNYKYNWVWVKNTGSGIAQAKYSPMRYNEDVCVFYKSLPTYNAQLIERTEGSKKRCKTPITNGGNGEHIQLVKTVTQYDSNFKNPSNVIYFNTDPNSKGKLHPTQKPVSLMEYFVRTYTNEGEIVLDNTAGSGTTAIACINTNRNYILIEKEQKYFDVINERIDKHNKRYDGELSFDAVS